MYEAGGQYQLYVDHIEPAGVGRLWLEFERLIRAELETVARCVDRALAAAVLRPAEIDPVLRVGGSSRIPCYIDLLAERFGSEKLQEMDVFTSVAAGLAIAAQDERLREQLQVAGALA